MSDAGRAELGDEDAPGGRFRSVMRVSSMISIQIRGVARWPGQSRMAVAALWLVLALLALATITPSKADTPKSVYYAMEFDAEIEGERFSIGGKVDCRARPEYLKIYSLNVWDWCRALAR